MTTAISPDSYYCRAVPFLDSFLNTVALFIGKYSRVVDAGAFLYNDGHYYFEAWKDEEREGAPFGCYTLRLGRVELTLDYRIPKAT